MHPVSTGGFSSAAGSYARARPGYAREAVGLVKEAVRGGPLLDLAAGTGILTGQLSRAGVEVYAAEPVPEMLEQLVRSLPGVPAVAATAEALPFDTGSFAALTVAQAFHWFDAPRALSEIARVLTEGGALAMLFNVRDESVDWVRELADLVEDRSGGRPYSDQRERSWEQVVADHGAFGAATLQTFANPVPSSPASILERLRSTSFVAVMDHESRESLLAEAAELVAGHPELRGRERFDYPHRCEVRIWRTQGPERQ